MTLLTLALGEFVDSLEAAQSQAGFRAAADRLAARLGYQWFAYLGSFEGTTMVLSSYPPSWAERYFERRYEDVDPVLRLARSGQRVFHWNRESLQGQTASQRRFFSEAAHFGIHRGVTAPIRGGYGRFAAFTLAGGPNAADNGEDATELMQLAALYYHAHVYAKLGLGLARSVDAPLTTRELQCLAWAARGKKMAETAKILGISTRTVVFHLENAKAKLGAATIAQAVLAAKERGAFPA